MTTPGSRADTWARVASTLHITGVERVRAALRRMSRAGGDEALGRALYREGEAIMAKSKEIVPVDTGVLRSTGRVIPPVQRGGETVVALGFGGPSAPYAARQHEDLSLRHKPGQQAKYLEQPAVEAVPGMADRIADEIEQSIKAEGV